MIRIVVSWGLCWGPLTLGKKTRPGTITISRANSLKLKISPLLTHHFACEGPTGSDVNHEKDLGRVHLWVG